MLIRNPISKLFLLALSFATLWGSCQEKPSFPVERIDIAPPVVEADSKFSNVYRPLDGQWQGTFFILRDTLGQRQQDFQSQKPDSALFSNLPLKVSETIEVTQVYVSESPYFQRVEITDQYRAQDGQLHEVHSRGVNKIQDGKMWCVVAKPGEMVVHAGSTAGDSTIIWRRDLRDPLKQECFREVVSKNRYQVWGWG